MALVLLRRVAAFTELLNYHLSSRSLSSRASRDLHNDNQPPPTSPISNEGIISSKYESSLQLSPLFSNTAAQVDNFKIELVDDETWRISQGLSRAWRRVTTSALETKAPATRVVYEDVDYVPPNKEDPDLDEIEDMRIHGNLYYKLDRSSKEFEEYNFDFHGKKSAKHKGDQAETKKKEDPSSNSASKLENSSKIRDERKEIEKKEDRRSYSASKLENSSKIRDERKEIENKEDRRSYSASKLEKTSKARDERKESKKKEEPKFHSTFEPKKSFKNRDERKESKKKENASNKSVPREEWLPDISKSDETDSSCIGKRLRTPTFNQLTAPYHEPFCLDIYISKASVRACIIHRATSKVVAVAHSISKDMKFDLGSTRNATACTAVGQVLAQRALADDIHNAVYTPRKGDKLEGKLQIVLQAIIDNGINVKVKIKQRKLKKAHFPPRA